MPAKYKLKFWFEWAADTAFQSANDAARDKFNLGMIDPHILPLTPETIEQVIAISQWHDDYLNWSDPAAPLQWYQEECDRFNAAFKQLFETVVRELGDDFEVINTQDDLAQDPLLDEYLKDPEKFRKRY